MVLIMTRHYKTLFVALTGMLLLSQGTFGQRALLNYADKQSGLENYALAAEAYGDAYSKKESLSTAVKLAETYGKLGDYGKSYEWWSKAVSFEGSGRAEYLGYLNSAVRAGKWEEMGALLSAGGYTEADFPEIDFAGIRALYGQRANVKLVQAGMNSDGSDYGTSVGPDGTLYFASDRGGQSAGSRPGVRLDARNNIFSTERDSYTGRDFYRLYGYGSDGRVSVLVTDLAEVLHMNDPALMEGGDAVFYTAFVSRTKLKGSRDFTNYPGIYYGKLGADGNITGSTAFPYNDHVSYGVMNPYVDTEMKRIYFASDMPGGYGGYDIYYVEYSGEMEFGTPVNLGPEVNTAENESHPSRSGSRFYFSSRGHTGLGGMDVFTADHLNGEITGVMNMGIPYNSPGDDFAYVVAGDGKRYLSSDREGGLGLDDIYTVEDLYRRLVARVVDCDGNLIPGGYEAELGRRDGSGMLETRMGDRGELLADLDPETDFSLRIGRKGYFSITDDSLSTKGFAGDTVYREYRLAAIPYRTPVYVDIVYYDLDRSEIRKDAEPALDKVAELMNRYGFMDLLVGSHTDSRASDAYNESLSERRADAVRGYLSKYGIPGDRVRLEWYGEQDLVNGCGDGVPCGEPDHQLNRRSELVLEAFPDPEKQYELPAELMGRDVCDRESFFEGLQDEINSVPTVYFDFDRWDLRQVHRKELERVAVLMGRMDGLQLYIGGHTDQRGSEDYNRTLSERRAKSVMDYLVKRGVDGSRMQHEWFGEGRPVNDCSTGDCTEAMHQQNRRTELRLGRKK
ncbi:OmpA family protein [Shivajiella indica]|uniref:OmpA family protein n=1 Tax=Shivajiella indica TaxID=872115 RepID=A0ABW5B1J8_9BACT